MGLYKLCCMRLSFFLSATLQWIMFIVQKFIKFGMASSVILLMVIVYWFALSNLKAKN